MTRDEIQKLIGGYATGSLTESERKRLFDAALEDQELFDQLAHEQALKELLEEPGAKQRLISALGPEQPSRVAARNRWPWAIAAAAACFAVVIGVVTLRTPEKPREIAAVTKPAEPPPVIATQDAAPVTPPVAQSAPVRAKVKAAEPAVENAPAAAAPPPPPVPPEPPKAEPTAPAPVDAVKEVAPMPALPPAPPPAPVINGFVGGAAPQLQAGGQSQAGQPVTPAIAAGGRGAGGGGGRGGGRGGRAPQAATARLFTTRFSFDYSFDPSGALRIVPSAPGYLSVTMPDQPTPTVLLPARNVVRDTPVVVQVPPEASELVVSFSATPAAVTGTPTRREESAGTVADPNQRILVAIPVKR